MTRFAIALLERQWRRSRPADRFDRERPYDAMLRINCELAAENVLRKGRRFLDVLKANFDPNQPRWPRGSGRIGGRWRPGDGSASEGHAPEEDRPARRRLASDEGRPPPPGTALQFAARLAFGLIRNYRKENNLLDFFGSDSGSTVAVSRFRDKLIFGVNSDILEYSTAYTVRDEAAAKLLRGTMLKKYPSRMSLGNIGQTPNDAVFHAEATLLLRAARENGGTLKGESLIVFVDKPMCDSCKKLLPLIGLELGNPTVTFVNRRGRTRTMRSGDWD